MSIVIIIFCVVQTGLVCLKCNLSLHKMSTLDFSGVTKSDVTYDKSDVLMDDNCCIVYSGTVRTHPGTLVAVHVYQSKDDEQRVSRGIEVTKAICHPAVEQFVCSWKEETQILVTVGCKKTLKSVMDGERRGIVDNWDSTDKSCVAIGIAAGLCAIHQKCAVHRDVKPSNVLLDENNRPKITDFSFSRFVNDGEELTIGVGSPLYMAPELFNDDNYTSAVDVYSYGMTLYELVTQQIPFADKKGLTRMKLMRMVVSGERPSIPGSCSEGVAKIIRECWDSDPAKRPTMKQIMNRSSELVFDDSVDMKEYQIYVRNVSASLDLR